MSGREFFSYNYGNRMSIPGSAITWMVCTECGSLVDSAYLDKHEEKCWGKA